MLLHTNTLTDDDMCMATPALAGDRLLIRTAARLYCLRLGESLEETVSPPNP
jgi:outer membrane protein assembly factor BamB